MRDFLSFKTLNYEEQHFFSSTSLSSVMVMFRMIICFFLLLSQLLTKFLCEILKVIKIQKQAPRLTGDFGNPLKHTHTIVCKKFFFSFLTHTFKQRINICQKLN